MLGIYPKVDSSHGFGFYSIIVYYSKAPTKCTETSRKIPSTVTVLSVCGSWLSLHFTSVMNSTTTFSPGIGTERLHVKTERTRESEWEMRLPRRWLRKPSVSKLPNGVGCHTTSTQSEEDCHQVWVTPMMSEPCMFQLATESTDTLNTTDIRSEMKKRQWFKDDTCVSHIKFISLHWWVFCFILNSRKYQMLNN